MQLFSMKSKLASPLHKPFERFFFFLQGAPTPFRSPGNHGNEDQERTLSCWRPEPGFGGGNEQRGGGGGGGQHSPTLQAIRLEAQKKKKSTEGGKNMRHRMREVNPRQVSGRVQLLYSPFWSPARVCFAPKPSPRRLVLRMLQTQTP